MSLKNFYDVTQMDSCAEDLDSLGPDTEPEFLHIGETLNNLATICFGMTDDALQLASLSNFSVENSNTSADSFFDETKNIFNEVATHVNKTINSFNQGEYLLVDLLNHVKNLRQPIQTLYGIGKTFRVLGINVKIESSRNINATQGFNLLAMEIADIAMLVQNNCQYCNEKASLIEGDISTSMKVFHNSNNKYDDQGEKAIHVILNALEEVGSKSEELAAGIQERSTAMVQGISDVVMAMQFHDISRQQLENIAKALIETTGKVQSLTDRINDDEEEKIALEVYGILSIQAAHLNSIYEQVLSARKQIEAGLLQTMDQAQVQAKDAKTLLDMEGRGGNKSVVKNLEDEIDNIVISLNKSLDVVKQAAAVSQKVYENVSEIGGFVEKIEKIAFDVKVLAINAMVEAIKTGETGATLNVLAKELSNLSQETRTGATLSIEKLQEIMKKTEKQLEFSTNLSQDMGVVDLMIERAKTLTGTILSTMQTISALAQKMDKASLNLASQITRLIPGIKFPQVMGDRIAKNWMTICKVIDQLEERFPQFLEQNFEVKEMLEKLAQQYVMDRERSIHAQVAGGAVSIGTDVGDVDLFGDDGFELFADDTDQESPTAEESEFGDNVDLF